MEIKKIIILVLLLSGLTQACSCLAFSLEQDYPTVPGVRNLEEIPSPADEGSQFGSYIKYFVRLALYLAIGTCLVILLIAGVIYLVLPLSPRAVLRARTAMKRSLLGLAIVLSSYLILLVINPQLLLQIADLPILPDGEILTSEDSESDVVFIQIPGFVIPPDIYTKVFPYKEAYIQTIGGILVITDGFGNSVDPDTGAYLEEDEAPATYPEKGAFLEVSRFLSRIVGDDSLDVPDLSNFMYQAELPFYKAEETAEDIYTFLAGTTDSNGNSNKDGVIALLENCKCGEAAWRIVWEGIKGECETFGANQLPSGEDLKKGGQTLCRDWYGFDDCGTKKDKDGHFICDVRDAVFQTIPVTVNINGQQEEKEIYIEQVQTKKNDDNSWKYFEWEAVGWEPGAWTPQNAGLKIVIGTDKINLDRLLRYKVQKLQELLAELKAQQPQFTAGQFAFLGDTLRTNATEFLLSEGAEIQFQQDFLAYKKYLESFDLKVEVILPKHLEPQEKAADKSIVQSSVSRLTAFINPFVGDSVSEKLEERAYLFEYPSATAYLVKHGRPPFISQNVIDHNQFIIMESQRASLFSVLTGLSLEAIQDMFKDCLTLAFGEADYQLPDNFTDIIDESMEQGIMDRVIEEISKFSLAQGLSDTVADGMAGVIYDDLSEDLILHCTKDCDNAGKCEAVNDCFGGGNACSLGSLEARVLCLKNLAKNEPCVKKCIGNTISPTIISDSIASFFMVPLKEKLPDSIQETLDEKLRDNILTERLNKILDSEMVALYDKVLDKALTKSFTEQIPQLQRILEKKLNTVPFLDKVFGVLNDLDKYLDDQLKGLKSYIAKETDSFKEGLKRNTVGFVQGKIDNYKEKNPGLFLENSSINDCFSMLDEGYVFEVNEDFIKWMKGLIASEDAPSQGKCVKLTPERLNGISSVPRKFTIDGDDNASIDVDYKLLDIKEKEILCQDAVRQCWGQTISGVVYAGNEDGEVKANIERTNPTCYQCSSVEVMDVTKINIGRLKDRFKAGLITFGEQLLAAFIDVMTETLYAYAEVWVEDNLVAPIAPYLSEASSFYENFHKFLNVTVQDVLPEAINETLQGNVNQILGDLCSTYRNEEEVDIKLYSLGEGLTWKGSDVLTEGVPISEEAGNAICKLSDHFETTLLEELAYSSDEMTKASEWINKDVKELLQGMCPDDDPETTEREDLCIDNLLEKSPAQILWPEYDNILGLIKASPKQFICGEHISLTYKETDDSEGRWLLGLAENGNSVAERCNEMKSIDFGFFPSFNGGVLGKMSEEKKKIYTPWCYFIYSMCESPVSTSFLGQGAGKVIVQATGLVCEQLDKEAKTQGKCPGTCLGQGMPDNVLLSDANCSDFYKIGCFVCNNVLNNSLARDIYYGAIQLSFGPIETRDKQKEIKAYQFLLVLTPLLELEIKEVAKQRGLGAEWASLVKENRDIEHFTNMARTSADLEDPLILFISYFTDPTRTPRDFLTTIPLGVIKPMKQGERTLLESQRKTDYNFLSKSPQELLAVDVCEKIKKDFKTKYPEWTIEVLEKADWRDFYQRKRAFLPYSPELLDSPSTGKAFDAIFQSTEIESDMKAMYLSCISLDHSPAQILRLNQSLIKYVKPEEYQILFTLLKDKMDDSERPEMLNQVLDYLFEEDPVSVLYKIAESLSANHIFDMTYNSDVAEWLNGDIPNWAKVPEVELGEDWQELVLDKWKDRLKYIGIDLYVNKDKEVEDPVFETEGFMHPNLWMMFQYHGINLPTTRPVLVKKISSDLNAIQITDDYEEGWRIENKYEVWNYQGNVFKVYVMTNDERVVDRSAQNAARMTADFLTTKIRNQLENPLDGRGQQAIIDMAIEQYCSVNFDTHKKNLGYQGCVAQFFTPFVSSAGWVEVQRFLLKTPAQIVEEYLTKPLLPGPFLDEENSIMGKIASATFLGKPFLDTIGKGWLDKAIVTAGNAKAKTDAWVDRTVDKKKDQIKATMDKVFLEAPQAIAGALVGLIAKAAGLEFGKSLADEIAGACYEADRAESCLTEVGEIYRVSNGVGQCCNMGKAVACSERCMMDIEPEKPNDEKCKSNIDDLINTTYQLYPPDEIENGGCCNVVENNNCLSCRPINAAQGAKCREDEELKEVQGLTVCCHKERYIAGEIKREDMCCTTVLECVSYKFADALEVVAEMLADGIIPLDSLTGR